MKTMNPMSIFSAHARVLGRGLLVAALVSGAGCGGGGEPLVPCGVEERNSPNGDPFAYTHLGYDRRGELILEERDRDIDGVVDTRISGDYHSSGGLSMFELSQGDVTLRLISSYGDDDRILSVERFTIDDDDTAIGLGRVDYEHTDRGAISRWDRNGDGTVDDTRVYTYDANGSLIRSELTCRGVADPVESVTIERGSDGQIQRIETSVTRPGEQKSSHSTDYQYDGDRLTRFETEIDGHVENMTAFTYDDDGQVIEVKRSQFSSTEPGYEIWGDIITSYDAQGRILRDEFLFDGSYSKDSTYLYECPGYPDSPGRSAAVPDPLPAPRYQGPRGGLGMDRARALFALGPCPLGGVR